MCILMWIETVVKNIHTVIIQYETFNEFPMPLYAFASKLSWNLISHISHLM